MQPTSSFNHSPVGQPLARSRRPKSRPGLSLIEVLIAISLTLILLLVLIRAFTLAGGEITDGRAVLEMSGQLRSSAERLRLDLKGLTVPVRPWTNPGDGLGYFEIVEGPLNDIPGGGTPNYFGDVDDVMMMTVRSRGKRFRGRQWPAGAAEPTMIESDLAEIIWWTSWIDRNGNGVVDGSDDLRLHRRVLLIRPDLAGSATLTGFADLDTFYATNDISVRVLAGGTLMPNSLGDLTKRENRFAHAAAFPHQLDLALLRARTLTLNAAGEEVLISDGSVMLSNVCGFDVRLFDPNAVIYDDQFAVNGAGGPVGTLAVVPGDRLYQAAVTADRGSGGPVLNEGIGMGAYVDLNYNGVNGDSLFSGPSSPGSGLSGFPFMTYCTWPTHYESDGIDQFTDGFIDQATDGIDNDNANGPDDVLERETSPPYAFPLRGVQVTFRMIEHDTRQVRQTSVVSNFSPE